MRSKQMYLFFAECLLKKREEKHVMGEAVSERHIKKVKRDSRLISPQKYNYIMKR